MQRSRLVLGLAAVFAGLTVLLVVLAAVLQDVVALLAAIPFAAATYIFWQQATGRFQLRFRPPRPGERTGPGQRGESGGRGEWGGRAGPGGPGDPGGRGARAGHGGFGAGPREDWVPPGDRRRRAGGRYRRARERYRRADAGDGPTDAEAYRTLDLEVGADEAAVRAAYRERVKEVHPDRPGGDEEAFKRVTDAYERLVGE